MSWEYYNPNPVRSDGVGDCAVRAIAKALGLSWEEAFARLAYNAYLMGDMPSSDAVWGALLRQNGFVRKVVPNTCPDCYTVGDFADDHPSGVYIIKSSGHVAVVEDGTLYDSWDSSGAIPMYYWTEQ